MTLSTVGVREDVVRRRTATGQVGKVNGLISHLAGLIRERRMRKVARMVKRELERGE